MSTCLNSSSYLSSTRASLSTTVAAIETGTTSESANGSLSLIGNPSEDDENQFSNVRELLSDEPHTLEETIEDMLGLLEEAIYSNFSKYIDEGSSRNVTAFIQVALALMQDCKSRCRFISNHSAFASKGHLLELNFQMSLHTRYE